MESLILASTLIAAIDRDERRQTGRPLYDALDDPMPALWTIVGAIGVAVLTGCVGTVLGG